MESNRNSILCIFAVSFCFDDDDFLKLEENSEILHISSLNLLFFRNKSCEQLIILGYMLGLKNYFKK